jgi:hypothetical protein
MMRRYQDWKNDQRYLNDLQSVLEWNVRDFFNKVTNRGNLGQESQGQMDRLSTLIGFAPTKWNVFGKSSGQRGQEFMAKVRSGDVKGILAATNPNSPFRQAYDTFDHLKKTYQSGGLTPDDVKILTNVALGAYPGGNINAGELRNLWGSVVGVEKPGNTAPVDENDPTVNKIKQNALRDDVHTPLHLLRKLFSVGGGVFAAPNNIQELRIASSDILKQHYRSLYNRLYYKNYAANDPKFRPKKKQANTNAAPPAPANASAAPAPAPAPANAGAPNQQPAIDQSQLGDAINNLQTAMKNPADFHKISPHLQGILSFLQTLVVDPNDPANQLPTP